MIEPHRLCND